MVHLEFAHHLPLAHPLYYRLDFRFLPFPQTLALTISIQLTFQSFAIELAWFICTDRINNSSYKKLLTFHKSALIEN